MTPVYEIFAIRYATMTARTPAMNYLSPDPHETTAADLDYFVWLIRGGGRDILVDTGFNEAASLQRKRTLAVNPADALAQFGVVEFHAWGSHLTHLDQP
ncbi:MAG: N-acyl homoserine lactonase family protein, partial [Hyphomicrobiales bacterium]|nr:N-acyl homoserine lactonase family protein [Hyphomicrobiales bacterium]